METTIRISGNVKATLDRMKIFERESYNEIIERMIEDDLELNERTKKEIEERRKNPQLTSHEDARKRLGL
jgi:predicted CopG family antitoxin